MALQFYHLYHLSTMRLRIQLQPFHRYIWCGNAFTVHSLSFYFFWTSLLEPDLFIHSTRLAFWFVLAGIVSFLREDL